MDIGGLMFSKISQEMNDEGHLQSQQFHREGTTCPGVLSTSMVPWWSVMILWGRSHARGRQEIDNRG